MKKSALLALVVFASPEAVADEPPSDRPPYERLLTGDDAARADEIQMQIDAAEQADRYDKAIQLCEELLTLRTQVQGVDHWQAAVQSWALVRTRAVVALSPAERSEWRSSVESLARADRLYAQGEYGPAQPLYEAYRRSCEEVLGLAHPETARAYDKLGFDLYALGRYAEAQTLFRSALAIHVERLGERHPDSAGSYNNVALTLNALGRYKDALPLYEQALAIRREQLGEQNPFTAISYGNLAHTRNALGDYAQAQPLYERALEIQTGLLGEKHANTAILRNNLAINLNAQAKYAEAQPLLEQVLAQRLERYGERHPDTALSYNNLAANLDDQGQYAQAQPLYQKALELCRELLGERHPRTAASYGNLAHNLNSQEKFEDAQPLFQRALELYRELFGEDHPDTAGGYANLAANLDDQAKHAEAQPLHRRAVDGYRALAGDSHPLTATSYNSLALGLNAQGKYPEAESLFRQALAIRRELLGEQHADTAASMLNLASNLLAQRRFLEAEPLFEESLGLHLALHGERHAATAVCLGNLGCNLASQQKYAEARPHYEKALALAKEQYGEKHHVVAAALNNLAFVLYAQGQYADAEPLYREALRIALDLLGELHPDTVRSYGNLASCLYAQGRYEDARTQLLGAASVYEAARLRMAADGLDRAVFGAEQSPYPLLAVTQARLGDQVAASGACESDLSRGGSDELARRRRDVQSADALRRQSECRRRLQELDGEITALVAEQSPTPAQTAALEQHRTARRELHAELSRLAVEFSQHQVASLDQIQGSLPENAALVYWVDIVDEGGRLDEHWGCVIRGSEEPRWEQLPDVRPESQPQSDDTSLTRQFLTAIDDAVPAAEMAALAERLHARRLAPLEKYLDGVTRLYVIPVGRMADVPLDVLTDRYVVSYVPSGSFLTRTRHDSPVAARALLALGDPVFPVASSPVERPLPPGGLLVTQAIPGGSAAQAGLQAGDVLLTYAGTELTDAEQLGRLQQQAQTDTIDVSVWRDGLVTNRQLTRGRLGVAIDRQPAPRAIAARWQADQLLATVTRGGDWSELPGTTVEVARLQALVGDDQTTLLTRSDASEQSLEQLRADGKLKDFRFLHFATHGEPNNARAFESALILAQDQISGEIPKGGGKYYDGRLTAGEVLENWELNADLVTLSACESALGRPGGGDGLLGFAQAFLLAGARSVCLSLWKVDDTATALLMDRFYQNLLGKREGLDSPMAKAEALAEAKQWLRKLTTEKVKNLTQDISAGVNRGKGEAAIPAVLTVPQNPVDAEDPIHPFLHPRYWAAFILIGDPD